MHVIMSANEAKSEAIKLCQALADVYTGRDPLALTDIDPGQWAEEIIAALEYRDPQEPA